MAAQYSLIIIILIYYTYGKRKKTPLSIIIRDRGDLWGLLNGVS